MKRDEMSPHEMRSDKMSKIPNLNEIMALE